VEQLVEIEVLLSVRDLERDLLVEPGVFREIDRPEPPLSGARILYFPTVCPRKNILRGVYRTSCYGPQPSRPRKAMSARRSR
jgi:hypothetical protein